MGELEPWIDENFVRSIWYNMGETVNVKMIRDKFSGYVRKSHMRKELANYQTAATLDIASLTSLAPKLRLRRSLSMANSSPTPTDPSS
jgi:hypothetical protein